MVHTFPSMDRLELAVTDEALQAEGSTRFSPVQVDQAYCRFSWLLHRWCAAYLPEVQINVAYEPVMNRFTVFSGEPEQRASPFIPSLNWSHLPQRHVRLNRRCATQGATARQLRVTFKRLCLAAKELA